MEEIRLFRSGEMSLANFQDLYLAARVVDCPESIREEYSDKCEAVRFNMAAAKLLRASNAYFDYEIDSNFGPSDRVFRPKL